MVTLCCPGACGGGNTCVFGGSVLRYSTASFLAFVSAVNDIRCSFGTFLLNCNVTFEMFANKQQNTLQIHNRDLSPV